MKNYFAPEVEVLDVMVEQGFAASDVINAPEYSDEDI